MQRRDEWFGAGLYLSAKPTSISPLLTSALLRSGGNVAGIQMEMIAEMQPAAEHISKIYAVTDETLEALLSRAATGEAGSVAAFDHWIDVDASIQDNPEDAHLTLDINFGDNFNKGYIMCLDGPCQLYKQKELVNYLRDIVCQVGVLYGCILSGWDWYRVSSVLTLTPQMKLDEFLYYERSGDHKHPALRFQDEIAFYQSRVREFGEWIPRGNWGTVLSSVHIEKLGGEEHIRRQSGCYIVERWGRNIYLQLTESLWDVTKEDLIRLDHYFKPIKFPDAPEPVYL